LQEDIYKFFRINDHLATSGQPTPEQFVDIAMQHYQLIINLAEFDSTNAIYNEEVIVKSLYMEYVHIPVKWRSPKTEDYQKFVEVMEANKAKKTFVHCAANKRVSVFVSLYRIQFLKESPDQVFADLHKIWQPDEIWQAFLDLQLISFSQIDE